jgi:hypothetical protein
MLARCLRRLGHKICGLWPVSAETEFEHVPQDLAMALASLGLTVGVVASPATWWEDSSRNELSVTAFSDGVESLLPARTRTGSLGSALEQALEIVSKRYACTLLDLSGLDVIAAQEVALVPGVGMVLFVPSGRFRERSLAKLRRRFPTDRMIGAVLVDESPRPRFASV